MQHEIEKLDWMSPATKQEALRKLHAIRNKIGYPDKWRDYSALDDQARRLLRQRHPRRTTLKTARRWNKLGKPVDRDEWGMTPPTVNAYYNPQMNDINFPAGVLQPPLYDPKDDDAPNYGNTGATIGHELTHGFDDEGRQFDAPRQPEGLVDPSRRQGLRRPHQLRARPVRDLRHRRRHPHQLQAHQRRRRSRHRRHPARLHRLEEADRRPDAATRATASPPTSASSSAWRSGPAKTSAPRTSASTPSPTPTPLASPASTESSPTCPSSRKLSPAKPASPWSRRTSARSGSARIHDATCLIKQRELPLQAFVRQIHRVHRKFTLSPQSGM